MEYTVQELEDKLKLNIKGQLNIEWSEALKTALIDAINQPKPVVVDLENVSEISLSTLQLLCAAHRSSAMKNKKLSLSGRTDVFRDIVGRAGYRRREGCKYDRNKNCIWLEEQEDE
jgi:anti-anti-sigma factor